MDIPIFLAATYLILRYKQQNPGRNHAMLSGKVKTPVLSFEDYLRSPAQQPQFFAFSACILFPRRSYLLLRRRFPLHRTLEIIGCESYFDFYVPCLNFQLFTRAQVVFITFICEMITASTHVALLCYQCYLNYPFFYVCTVLLFN